MLLTGKLSELHTMLVQLSYMCDSSFGSLSSIVMHYSIGRARRDCVLSVVATEKKIEMYLVLISFKIKASQAGSID